MGAKPPRNSSRGGLYCGGEPAMLAPLLGPLGGLWLKGTFNAHSVVECVGNSECCAGGAGCQASETAREMPFEGAEG